MSTIANKKMGKLGDMEHPTYTKDVQLLLTCKHTTGKNLGRRVGQICKAHPLGVLSQNKVASPSLKSVASHSWCALIGSKYGGRQIG